MDAAGFGLPLASLRAFALALAPEAFAGFALRFVTWGFEERDPLAFAFFWAEEGFFFRAAMIWVREA
ncbi:MAG TPA: hypothetical protein VI197_06490 [Polyangiaceae bacterium]